MREQNLQPVFRDTPQALQVAYLVLSMPPRQGEPFRNVLIRMLEDLDRPNDQQQAWLGQLRGTPGEGTINFRGLSPEEVRAQCSMVTAAVRDRLPAPEAAAVLARYGHGEEKLEACKRLAVYARRSSGLTALSLLLDLTARHYLPTSQAEGLTVRAIAERHKVSKDRAFRAAKWMQTHFRALENIAFERLERGFVSHGLVAARPACEQAQALAA